MARKPIKRIYDYKCTMTEESFQVTREAPHPSELVSVAAYYQLNPDKDDRPDYIKKTLGILNGSNAEGTTKNATVTHEMKENTE